MTSLFEVDHPDGGNHKVFINFFTVLGESYHYKVSAKYEAQGRFFDFYPFHAYLLLACLLLAPWCSPNFVVWCDVASHKL